MGLRHLADSLLAYGSSGTHLSGPPEPRLVGGAGTCVGRGEAACKRPRRRLCPALFFLREDPHCSAPAFPHAACPADPHPWAAEAALAGPRHQHPCVLDSEELSTETLLLLRSCLGR